MKARKAKSIAQLFTEGRSIDAAMKKAAQEAQRCHRQAGQPMVVWRKGKMVLVAPGDIPQSKEVGA
jgi:hypothetical protein